MRVFFLILSILLLIAFQEVSALAGTAALNENDTSPKASTMPLRANQSWRLDVGFRFFKHASTGRPKEIAYNRVFDRWESIHQDSATYDTESYKPLEPLYFNLAFGIDVFVRFRQYLLLRLGYDYSNPVGIGGAGRIRYVERDTGVNVEESKQFSYTSHQINFFFGPLVPVGNNAEIYLAIAPMAPTWVKYEESYSRIENNVRQRSYDKTFSGFFGSCRALFGAQVRVWKGLKIGSEITFALLNYMPLSAGKIEDYSFQFPPFKWQFTFRYELF